MRKWEALRWARAQRSLKEVAQRVCKEETWEEAEHQVQEEAWKAREVQEAWEAARHWVLEENEMNAHPEEDGDYVPNDAMDVNDRTALMTLAAHCARNTHTHTVTGVRSHVTRDALRVARPGTLRTNATVEGFRVRDGRTAH